MVPESSRFGRDASEPAAETSEVWDGARPPTTLGSEWSQRNERIGSLLTEARARTRWPLRRHRAIRSEVEDLYARLAPATLEWMLKKKLIRRDEYARISVEHLMAALFGEKPYLDEAINFYRENGYERVPRQ